MGLGPVLGHSGPSSGGRALLAPSPTSTSSSKHGLLAATKIAPLIAGSVGSGQGPVVQRSTTDSLVCTMSEAMNYVAPAFPGSSFDSYAMSSPSIEFLLGRDPLMDE